MNVFENILVVVDPTCEDQPAVHRAHWLAKRSGGNVKLLICYFNEYVGGERLFDAPSLQRIREEIIERHKQRLENLTQPLRADDISVDLAAVWDHPLHDSVVRQALDSNASLVIKDTHHHSALSRAILTNTDWNLIRTCPVPLWLVKPGELPAAPLILAAIDPMNEHDKPAALDDDILQLSTTLATKVGGTVHAFHAYDPRIAFATATANAYIPVSLPLHEIEQQMHEKHQKRFEEITRFHGVQESATHLVAGMAHEELPALSEELGADIVVMGAVTRNRWKRLLVGATAERTLEHLPCDMLVIKPDWVETPALVDQARAESN
jgi:universal stress protein E